jgi:hypothetical protein
MWQGIIMKHLIIIALLILSYGCVPKYTVPTADPLPVEQRNGISSQTMGLIKPDRRAVSYSYSYPNKQKIYNGYVLLLKISGLRTEGMAVTGAVMFGKSHK